LDSKRQGGASEVHQAFWKSSQNHLEFEASEMLHLLALTLFLEKMSPYASRPRRIRLSSCVLINLPRVEALAGDQYFSRSRLTSARNLCFSSALTKRGGHWKIGDSVTSFGRPFL
jgi:hypothetical protein